MTSKRNSKLDYLQNLQEFGVSKKPRLNWFWFGLCKLYSIWIRADDAYFVGEIYTL